MSDIYKTWLEEVKAKMNDEKINQSDLAQVVGVSPPIISDMMKYGKASDRVKLAVSKFLNIKSSWK